MIIRNQVNKSTQCLRKHKTLKLSHDLNYRFHRKLFAFVLKLKIYLLNVVKILQNQKPESKITFLKKILVRSPVFPH